MDVLRTRSPARVLAGELRTRSLARVPAGVRGYSRVSEIAWYSTRPGPPGYSRACGASPPPRSSAGRGGGPGKTQRRHHPTARAGTQRVNAGAYYRGTSLACNPRTRGCASYSTPPRVLAGVRVYTRADPAGNSRVFATPTQPWHHEKVAKKTIAVAHGGMAAWAWRKHTPPRTTVTRVATEGEASRHGSRDKASNGQHFA